MLRPLFLRCKQRCVIYKSKPLLPQKAHKTQIDYDRQLGALLLVAELALVVEAVLQHMSDALAAGTTVKISSFGTFSVRDKTARVGRNPKTGDEVPISPRRVLTFRPSHLMKDRVAAGTRR